MRVEEREQSFEYKQEQDGDSTVLTTFDTYCLLGDNGKMMHSVQNPI